MQNESPLSLVQAPMRQVDQIIIERLQSDVALINQMGQYIVAAGGKRLRPALVLLSAGAFDALDDRACLVSAIIEFIHTATLLHDDVVDESRMRRGRDTANVLWGNEASVLVGDFLYSRSFEMMVDVGDMSVMQVLAQTTNTIAEGEVMQLLNVRDPDTTEQRYIDVIRSKTAQLFAAACQLGAILGGQSSEIQQRFSAYGMHLGTAFQLVDDVLDYKADEEKLGKELGNDLAEGKPTLPLIHAMENGDLEQRQLLRHCIEQGETEKLAEVQEVIDACESIDYTMQAARREVSLATACLDKVPQSHYTRAMQALAEMSVARTF